MSFILTLLIAFVAAVQVPAPAPAAPAAPASSPQASLSYVVGASDVLTIKVFDEPTLSGVYNVDSDGAISFPFVGRVVVSTKTVRDVEALLTKLLADGYVRRPQVSVEISQFRGRSIFVLGEVRAPGKYSIEGQVTLLEVIAKAGSLTATAGNLIIVQRYKDEIPTVLAPALPGDERVAEIMRVSMDDLREGRVTANLLLQDGDTIFVPQADRFYVTGFVKSPGQFVLVPNMTVRQAIAVAGGLTERGSTRGMKIIRRVGDKEVEVDAKMSDPVKANDTIKIRQRLI
ncbi:MAG: polysaccharide biosynthesis/export family protein [Vicinamibacterales bacterium]